MVMIVKMIMIVNISYKIKFIDSFRFMSSSLSSLVSNLSDGVHGDKCTDCKSCLDYMSVKDDQLIFRCFKCQKNYNKDFNKDLIKRFENTYEFCDRKINKFSIAIGMQNEYSKALIIKILVIIMICMFKVIHYYLQMYLKILETNVLKYMNLIPLIFYQNLD